MDLDFINLINNFITHSLIFIDIGQRKFQVVLPWIKLISGFLSFLFFILVVWLIIKTQIVAVKVKEIKEVVTKSSLPHKLAAKEWMKIVERLHRGSEADLKLAIIEADKLFDETIKKMGFSGEIMSERLKKITPAQLSVINEIWNAHKIRNNIVHLPDYKLSREEAEATLAIYQKALKEWGLID